MNCHPFLKETEKLQVASCNRNQDKLQPHVHQLMACVLPFLILAPKLTVGKISFHLYSNRRDHMSHDVDAHLKILA